MVYCKKRKKILTNSTRMMKPGIIRLKKSVPIYTVFLTTNFLSKFEFGKLFECKRKRIEKETHKGTQRG